MANFTFNTFRTLSSIYRHSNAAKCMEITNYVRRIQTQIFIDTTTRPKIPQQQRQPIRHSSFRSSEPVGDIDANHPKVEIIRNAAEWKYVEAILPKPLVPDPKPKTEYPSGWKPQVHDVQNFPYFVRRTSNHMIPVYLHTHFRGQRRTTRLRRIQGDIWMLNDELQRYITAKLGKRIDIATRVNELSGQIWFHGDYVNLVKEYLMSKGL